MPALILAAKKIIPAIGKALTLGHRLGRWQAEVQAWRGAAGAWVAAAVVQAGEQRTWNRTWRHKSQIGGGDMYGRVTKIH